MSVKIKMSNKSMLNDRVEKNLKVVRTEKPLEGWI